MAAVKYKQYYQNMIAQNEEAFHSFKLVHDGYVSGKVEQETYNQKGMKVVDLIRDWDRRLCSAMGKGAFSTYSQKLSEKFWDEVRKDYSHIDKVGVIIKK